MKQIFVQGRNLSLSLSHGRNLSLSLSLTRVHTHTELYESFFSFRSGMFIAYGHRNVLDHDLSLNSLTH